MPITAYEATILYLNAMGIFTYEENRNVTPFTDQIVSRGALGGKVDRDIIWTFDLDGSLLKIE